MSIMDISARRQLLINDYEKYGDFQSGEYRGVKWEAVRASDKSSRESSPETSPVLSRAAHKRDIYRGMSHFLCGYITLDKKLFTRDSSIYEDCMLKAGRECTYDSENEENLKLGFDCAHYMDYPIDSSSDGVYRDFPYVLKVLQKTIDNILDL